MESMPPCDEEAMKWYRLVAEQGLADTQFKLAFGYRTGRRVLEDHKQAVKWYHLAAEQGNSLAQLGLGLMYAAGQGVLEDRIQAYAWLNVAGANGDKDANDTKSKLNLTQDSIEKARALSRKMVEENPKLLGD